ncbi:helix-turn-helix transcriptional regulator [Aquabacterium sp. J223]|uniref:helix-turn-helix transcriptional regulator n=1 Tax=Aquabacterium sp. J223 TaxID=2898431 RepID=UPI0021AD9524|nr:hypothetical protein [Aquabacterium sp. J223]UUX95789.1 hypothetical protein LRS07_00010 [Aquabacterium sp. J223]
MVVDSRRRWQSPYRQVVCAEEGDRSVIASVVPINQEFGADDRLALLILGRRRPVQPLAVDWFARCNGLTPSETRVLTMLCSGLSPHDIAKENGVAVSDHQDAGGQHSDENRDPQHARSRRQSGRTRRRWSGFTRTVS